MKRINLAKSAVFAVLVALAAASCSLMEPGTGSISISIPHEALSASRSVDASRAILSGPEASLKYVRVFLEANGSMVPLKKGEDFLEAEIPANYTIEISDVPPMRNVMVYVALSEKEKAGFRTVKFVRSEAPFNIVAGGTAELTLELKDSPFKDLSTDHDAAGVRAVAVGGTVYTLANNTLKWSNGSLPLIGSKGITAVRGLTKGRVVNSNGTFGADQVWINTDKGIFPLVGSTLGAPIVDNDVADSGVLSLMYKDSTGKAFTTSVAYYQRPGSVGIGQGKDGSWKWEGYNLKDYGIESTEPKLIADSSSSPEGTFAYLVVPAINSFRIGGDAVNELDKLGENPTFQQIQDTLLKGNTFTIPPVNGIKPLVQGVSFVKDQLFVGTNLGLFKYTVDVEKNGALPTMPDPADSSKTVLKPADPVKLPRVANIVRVRSILREDGAVFTAALTRNGALFLIKNGSDLREFRAFTGLPFELGEREAGKTADLFWSANGLVVSGTNGVVEMSFTAIEGIFK